MKLFLLTKEIGSYDDRETIEIGIFDSKEKAIKAIAEKEEVSQNNVEIDEHYTTEDRWITKEMFDDPIDGDDFGYYIIHGFELNKF